MIFALLFGVISKLLQLFRLCALFAVLLVTTSTTVGAIATTSKTADPFLPSLEDFMTRVQENWKEKTRVKEPLKKIEMGAVEYLPQEILKASQPQFTYLKVLSEIALIPESYGTTYDKNNDQFNLGFDGGRSVFPAQKAAIGILYRGRIYLLDGHHKVLISLYMNSETLPVRVIEDWSSLSQKDFRLKMIEAGYAYPYDHKGRATEQFYDFDQMTDNPNLFLARLLIQKIKGGIEFERFKIFSVSGAKKPLILKFNEGLPFIEFFIADLLLKNGISYQEEWGKKVPKRVKKEIRQILKKEAKKENSPLKNAILVKPGVKLEGFDAKDNETRMELVFDHFMRNLNCDTFLSPVYRVQSIE